MTGWLVSTDLRFAWTPLIKHVNARPNSILNPKKNIQSERGRLKKLDFDP